MGSKTAMRMMVPPMVGVPFLVAWVVGTVVLMASPICIRESQRIMAGPIQKVISSASTAAEAPRKVIYRKRLKPKNQSRSGTSRWYSIVSG